MKLLKLAQARAVSFALLLSESIGYYPSVHKQTELDNEFICHARIQQYNPLPIELAMAMLNPTIEKLFSPIGRVRWFFFKIIYDFFDTLCLLA